MRTTSLTRRREQFPFPFCARRDVYTKRRFPYVNRSTCMRLGGLPYMELEDRLHRRFRGAGGLPGRRAGFADHCARVGAPSGGAAARWRVLQVVDFTSTCDKLSHKSDPVLQPLKPGDARILARTIVEDGVVAFSSHAETEMKNDNLIAADCLNLIRGGAFEAPELINGEWRYRVVTQRMCVVITFVSETRLRVVTAWRNKQ